MLKVVVFDWGYGGEFFADLLEEKLPVIDIIRVIDWRNAEVGLNDPKKARKLAEAALMPYIGKVDLIIIANYLLSITSLDNFRKKYKDQKFIGFDLKKPDSFVKREVMILTTKAVTKTMAYFNYTRSLKRRYKSLTVDSWPLKIDDGELELVEIEETIKKFMIKEKLNPEEIILASSQFNDIKDDLKAVLGKKIKIYDSFEDTVRMVAKTLNIRGGFLKERF